MTYYIQQIHHFSGNHKDDKSLRQELKTYGVDARRLSRFTQLALLGALPLKAYLAEKSGIYLGSSFNSPSKFDKMFHQLTAQNLPSPLDFMANINNAATFQLAQTLQINGNSLFLAVNQHTIWQPLQLALLDLEQDTIPSALVGWVLETDNEQQEGACFWVISKDAKSAVKKLTEIDPSLVSPYGPNEMLDFQFMASFWILVCFGVVGLPHTAVRCMAFKDSKALHNGMLIGTIVLTVIMLGMHLAGALGRAIVPDLTVSDKVIPSLMLQVLPPIVAGIFLAAPMSAIMSTVDAQLIQSSSIFVKDLYLAAKPQAVQNQKRIGRISSVITLILTALLIFASLNPPDMIIWLNLFAFGGLEAAFLWVIVLGLYWDKANAYGAVSSMLVGLVSFILFTQFGIKLFGFNPIVPSLVFGLAAFLIGNKIGEKRHSS